MIVVNDAVLGRSAFKMCCEMATRQAREHGFKPMVVADATAARTLKLGAKPIPHDLVQEVTLAVLAQFGPVVDAAEAVAQMAASRKG